jgi:hypothetical protein
MVAQATPVTLPPQGQSSSTPAAGSGSAPSLGAGFSTGGTAGASGAYGDFSGVTAVNEGNSVNPGNIAPLTGGEFSTVLGGAQWLAKASAANVSDIQEWLIGAGLLTTTKGLTIGVVGPSTQSAWDHALLQSAASDGQISVGQYLTAASGQGGFTGIDQEIASYINTKPKVQPINVTSTADIQNVYDNAYRLTHGVGPSPQESATFANYYQDQQATFQQQLYSAQDVADASNASKVTTLTQLLGNTSNLSIQDFVKSYGQTMTGPSGTGTATIYKGIGKGSLASPGGPQPVSTVGPNRQYYVDPAVWQKYGPEYGAGHTPESKVSPDVARKVFLQIAATVYHQLGSWGETASFLATGSAKSPNGTQITTTTIDAQNTNAAGIASAASGGIISPSGQVAVPVVQTSRQIPELQGEAAQYAEGQNVPQVDATSMASLGGEIIDRMFRPGGYQSASTTSATSGAGMPGNTALSGQAGAYVQPTVQPAIA